jgi:hypothetical protein
MLVIVDIELNASRPVNTGGEAAIAPPPELNYNQKPPRVLVIIGHLCSIGFIIAR